MSTQRDEANAYIMGGGVPWARFENPGDTLAGVISATPVRRQSRDYDTGDPAVWGDGSPVYEVAVVLDTDTRNPDFDDDDGKRQFVINSASKRAAVRDAVTRSGAAGLALGGRLQVTYTGDGEPKRRGLRGPKLFTARYAPPPPVQVPVDDPDQGPIPF